MRSVELEIMNATGLHARPAALFVKTAAGFRAMVRVRNVERDGPAANAKSILAVLAQGAGHGSRIEITAEGEDEDVAIDTLGRLIEDGLGEGSASGASEAGPAAANPVAGGSNAATGALAVDGGEVQR